MQADTIKNSARTAQILLVEDNLGDVILAQKAMSKLNVPYKLTVAKDGEEALNIMYLNLNQEQSMSPDIVLLDLNLPRKSGLEVLEEIKQHPHLKQIPVLIFSSSRAGRDVIGCYSLHANSYLCKPQNFEEYAQIIEVLESFWLKNAILPTTAQ